MRIIITGAGGFIGTTLTAALLEAGYLTNAAGEREPIDAMLLVDTALPPATDQRITLLQADLCAATLQRIAAWRPDSIFHLAAVYASAAERDPAGAFRGNVAALEQLLEAVGNKTAPPRLIFTSSIAVFGGLLPDTVDDDHLQRPQTSYGTHKAMAELMLVDATRRGVVDARVLRLPIVLVHPGPPTQSVSDRIAAVVRDGVAGRASICPLRPDTRVPVVSAATVARNIITLHDAEPARLRGKRVLNQPALTIAMADIVESVARVIDATPDIRYQVDTALKTIVDGWPRGFISTRAPSVGIVVDKSFEDIVERYLDRHGPQKPAA